MKKLYVSDLDGTLLNSSAELTKKSIEKINMLYEKNIYFTAATARTPATVKHILAGCNLMLPVIVLSGVCLYDIKTNEYSKIEYINRNSYEILTGLIDSFGLSGFMYTIENNTQHTYYQNLSSPNAEAFVSERIKKYGKIFIQTDNFLSLDKTIYYSVSDKHEKLDEAYSEFKKIPDLNTEYYRDIYNEDFWYLEISSKNASKYNAVIQLKKEYGFDFVTGFGDNLNDLPLFLACDKKIAVSTAREQLLRKADLIIDYEDGEGVIDYIISQL